MGLFPLSSADVVLRRGSMSGIQTDMCLSLSPCLSATAQTHPSSTGSRSSSSVATFVPAILTLSSSGTGRFLRNSLAGRLGADGESGESHRGLQDGMRSGMSTTRTILVPT